MSLDAAGREQPGEPRAFTLPFAYLLTPTPHAVLFATKTSLSVILALLVGFWLQLSEPAWAATTAVIVSNPVSGQVFAKSTYRIVGTLLGVVATIAFVALFAQAPAFFIGAEALWIAACTYVSTVVRGFRSYGAVLAGYTAAILGFPSAAAPDQAFQLAVGRGSAILLGITCAGLLSALLIPRRSKTLLLSQLRSCLRSGIMAVEQALSERADPRVIAQAAQEVSLLPDLIVAAHRELPELRRSNAFIRSTIDAAMDLLSTAHALDLHWRRMSPENRSEARGRRSAIATRLQDVLVAFDAASPGATRRPVSEALSGSTTGRPSLADVCMGSGDVVVREITEVVTAIRRGTGALDAVALGRRGTPVATGAVHRDWLVAGRNAFRSMIGIALAGCFWIMTAWDAGVNVVVWTGITLSLLAARERQLLATFSFLKGAAVALPVAAVWKFAILPACSGFPLLAAALFPLVFVGALIVAGGPDPGFAATFGMIALSSLGIANVQTYPVADFLNTALAEVLGIGLAAWTYYTILPADLGRRGERIVKATVADTASLLRAPNRRRAREFISLTYDRLALLARIEAPPTLVDRQLLCLAVGREAIHLATTTASAERPAILAHLSEQAARLDRPNGQTPRAPQANVADGSRRVLDELVASVAGEPWEAQAAAERASRADLGPPIAPPV